MRQSEMVPSFQSALDAWYAVHQRDLPWRRTSDPYAVWVSEIMLQQTQVETVRPYFARWMEAFPTLEALAAAPADAVLKLWEGLGYYARARRLHRGAQVVADELGGRLPDTAQALRRLPGIGEYTAGAIASIAFGRDEPVLDGNVARVLCRVFSVRSDPKLPAVRRRLWALARRLLPKGRAGRFNQALMDLGATVCTPARPRCPDCPLERLCRARQAGREGALPARTPRRAVPHFDVAAGVIRRRDGRVLIDRRRPDGLLGGLWEFPGGKRLPGESLEDCLRREVREELAIEIEIGAPLITVRHAYTHFRITLHAFECRYVSGRPRALGCDAWRWVSVAELARYAFPKANHAILERLRPAAAR